MSSSSQDVRIRRPGPSGSGVLAVSCALAALVARPAPAQGPAPIQTSSTRQASTHVAASTRAPEAALKLTRQLPSTYVAACVEIVRNSHVTPCPPLVPEGDMAVRGWGDSLDAMSGVLNTINGNDIDAHGGHWTITVASGKGGHQALADDMHATGAKTPSRCRFLQLEGQRVEACRVPPYPDGGYYGNHIAYGWQRGGFTYNVTMHNHANEPRLRLMVAALIAQQKLPPVRVRFDKATVQRCPDDATVPSGQQLSMANASDSIAADRIRLTCRTVESLIAMAYVQYADGLTHSRWAVGSTGITVTGGASWLRTDTYAVEAVAPVNTSREMMLGPMLQTLLKDRFRLEVHRKNRDVPVYNLTGAGNWYAKLKPLEFKEGTCTKPDTVPESTETTPGTGQRLCASRVTSTGTGSRLDLEGTTLGGLANFLTAQPFIDRRVRDRIGYPGEYDFRLEFNRAADDQAHESTRASLFAALREQLGMQVELATGEAEFLVINRAQRPSRKIPDP